MGAHSAANQEAFHGVMAAVAAKVQAEIVPYIGGSDGPRELKIDHKKVSDAFKFNFHEDEKAQYQPDYMEGFLKRHTRAFRDGVGEDVGPSVMV
jgi:hypothetical protein